MLFYADKDSPAFAIFQSGLRARLEQELNAPVWIYEESFDEGWLGQGPSYERTMERFLRDKYAKRGIDIVVPIGDYPLRYMQKRRKTLLPESKLIYLSWRSPQPPVPDTTGLVLRLDLAPTLQIALAQNPGTRHVLLVAGATPVDRGMAQLLLSTGVKYVQEMQNRVDLEILSPGTFEENRSALSALPADTITVFVSYYADSAGQGFVPGRILRTLSAATNRPMYGWADSFFGRGIVGGNLLNLEANGAAFGNLVLRVVHGEEPGTIPEVSGAISQNMFDWRQMKRWGIGMDKVPAGSTVANREYTIWELYRWRITGLLVLIAIETVLIFTLVRLAFSQKQNVNRLAHEREREALLAELATGFINLPKDMESAEVDRLSQLVLDFFSLDRLSLYEFLPTTSALRLWCSRSAPGVDNSPQVIDLRQLPWTSSHVLRGEPMVVSHLGQLTGEASELKKYLRDWGVRSFLMLPLQFDEKTFAILNFATVRNEREWEPDLINTLRTVADILSNSLQRQLAEDSRDSSSNRLTGIVESAMDAIIAVDTQQRIVVFNATAERIFGCPMKEALGQSLDRFLPDRFRAQHHAHISRFAETGVTNRAMGTLNALFALRSNGEEFPIEASISQVKSDGNSLFTVIIRDVTERVRAEQALRESEELKASILDSLSNHLVVVNASGIVMDVNDPGFDLSAGNRLLAIREGANYFDVCRSEAGENSSDGAAALEGIQAVFDGKRDYFEMEYGVDSAPEQPWLLMSVTPLKGPHPGVVISHQDITERKRHERSIQELSGRLITAQEQERSRIARELHDDINQQVAMLAIELQQLKGFLPEGSSEGRRVQALWEKTHLLSTEIQRLTHHLHSAKLEHLGIAAALRGLCNEFAEQYRIEIDFQFTQVPPNLDSDIALSVFRVAQESLHNIAKHSHAKKVRMELVGTADKVALSVSDDGVGFDADAQRHGAGLGLISMGERIRLVGGTLSVCSRPTAGTQIEVAVPLLRGAAANRATRSVHKRRKTG